MFKSYKTKKNCRITLTRLLIKFSKALEFTKKLSKYVYNKYKILKNIYVKFNLLSHCSFFFVDTNFSSTLIKNFLMGTRSSWTLSSLIFI